MVSNTCNRVSGVGDATHTVMGGWVSGWPTVMHQSANGVSFEYIGFTTDSIAID